uniref:Formate dehydrogenase n=1 Tax=Kalanchoe fedtschenkoi TaxID=63787 RepID=A0A7N0UQG9_KALFE
MELKPYRIKKAKNLQLLLTSGIGSDHIDLKAATEAGLTVAEVTGSNIVSVAEDELMRILILVRNFSPCCHQAINAEWNIAAIAEQALNGEKYGSNIICRRPVVLEDVSSDCNEPFEDGLSVDALGCWNSLFYAAAGSAPGCFRYGCPGSELEKQTGAKFEEDLDAMLPKCDIIVINTPLIEKTKGMFGENKIAKLKRRVLIVKNARGAIMDTQAIADACSSGHVAGYSGDVWFPQPAPKDHPRHYMPNHVITPHISGTTIDAQL